MVRRIWGTLSLVIVVVLVLAMVGCAPRQPESNTPAATTPAEGGQIEFWTVFTGPDGSSMQKMVDDYNATNPKFQVVHRPIAAEELYTKIPTMVASGKGIPELAINHVERLRLFVEQGILTPLDEHLARHGKILSGNYVEAAWNAANIDGKQYAIPLDVHSFPMYYNVDLVNKYAPEVVEDNIVTWDEVRHVAELAKQDEVMGIGITWMRVKFLGWLAQLGGNLTNDGETPTINTPEAAKVLETFKGFHDDGLTTISGDDPIALFLAGKVVFLPEGIWMKNRFEEVPDFNWGMTHLVSFDTQSVYNWTSSHQIVMLKNPNLTNERIDGALDFVNWVGENSLEWARSGQNPAALHIMDNEEFRQMRHSFLLDYPDTLKIYDYKYYGYAVEALDKIVWETVFGNIGIQEGLEQAQKEVEDRIRLGQ